MSSPPADPSLPAWALAQAEAALTVGQTMPEIERGLMAKGLAAETATAAVLAVLEGRLWRQKESLANAKRRILIHRVLSAIVGIACLWLIYHLGISRPRRSGGGVLLFVTCIWFSDWMSRRDSQSSSAAELPGFFIRWCAWILLTLVFVVLMWLWITRRD
jgi:hypothetical protein